MGVRRGHLEAVDGPESTPELRLARRNDGPSHGVPPVQPEWCKQQLRKAYRLAAADSPDPSTQNAALAYDFGGELIGAAANRPTRGVPDSAGVLRGESKYLWMEHAERAALYSALRYGYSSPAILVCPWAPCADCARAIVSSGVTLLVRHRGAESGRPEWRDNIKVGEQILAQGEVKVMTFEGPLRKCPPIRVAGEPFVP